MALTVMLLLNRFYKSYKSKYFQYWSRSWFGLMLYMLGATLALWAAQAVPSNTILRTTISTLTIAAGLFQALWLLVGSFEFSRQKEYNRRSVLILSLLILPVAIAMALPFANQPDAVMERLFLRVGLKSFISGVAFVTSALLIYRLRRSGIGIRLIIGAFLLYGLEQFNYFLSFLDPIVGLNYFFEPPYYLGTVDFFLQTIMGIGMIVSVLELEGQTLKKTNTELDTFLYRASHDLRAPLTAILGLTSAAKQINEKKEISDFIDLIQIKINQADKVIKDIITLRKGQKVGLNIKKVNLNKLVMDHYSMVTSPTNKKVDLLIDEEQYIISSDSDRLQTIISNLISNAIKYHDYSQPEPVIKVSMKSTSDGVLMNLSDNGKGIDEKYLPKIFDMFYRADAESKGSGLGLYLTKDALDNIESKIEVTSVLGVGTSFKIHFKNLKE